MKQTKRGFSTSIVIVLLTIALFSSITAVLRSNTAQQSDLQVLGSVEEFQAIFNSDQGAPRLVLLLSPT